MKEISILQFRDYFLRSSCVLRQSDNTYRVVSTTNFPFMIVLKNDSGCRTFISGIRKMYIDEANNILQVNVANYFEEGSENTFRFDIENFSINR